MNKKKKNEISKTREEEIRILEGAKAKGLIQIKYMISPRFSVINVKNMVITSSKAYLKNLLIKNCRLMLHKIMMTI